MNPNIEEAFEDEQMCPPELTFGPLPELESELVGDLTSSEIIEALHDGVGLSLVTTYGEYTIDIIRGHLTFEVWPTTDTRNHSQSYPDLEALLITEASRPEFVLRNFEIIC